MECQRLIDCYIKGIIRRSHGIPMSSTENAHFFRCRNTIKAGLNSFQWLIMGVNVQIINVLMRTGDQLLANGMPTYALNFYREAGYLFPNSSICYVREALCLVLDNHFEKAKETCVTAIRLSDGHELRDILAIIDILLDVKKLQEARYLCFKLNRKFPQCDAIERRLKEVQEKTREAEVLFKEHGKKKKKLTNKKKKKLRRVSDRGIDQCSGIDQCRIKDITDDTASEKKSSRTSGGIVLFKKPDIPQNTTETPKVTKTSKKLKREYAAKQREIEREIEKAKGKQKEELKKQEEVNERKKKEKEEKLKTEAAKKQELEREKQMRKRQAHDAKKQRQKEKKSVKKKSSDDSYKTSLNGSNCPRTPCNFAHGKDEEEIWELCRSKGVTQRAQGQEKRSDSDSWKLSNTNDSSPQESWNCANSNAEGFDRSRTESCSSLRSSTNSFDPFNSEEVSNECHSSSQYSSCLSQGDFDESDQDSLAALSDSCSFSSLPDMDAAYQIIDDVADNDTTHLSDKQLKRGLTDYKLALPELRVVAENLPKSHSSGNAIQILCSVCQNTFSTTSEPELVLDSQECKICKRNELPVQAYWNERTSGLVVLRNKPDGIKNVQMCLHFLHNNVHDVVPECRFAHGDHERVLWEKELSGGKTMLQPEASSCRLTKDANQIPNTISLILEQEKFRCMQCDIRFSSKLQLEHHYSDTQHKIDAVRRAQPLWKQELDEQFARKCRPPPDGVYMGRYKLCYKFQQSYCHFGDKCMFAHGQEEYSYWITLYQRQVEHLAQLESQQLLSESFSQKVRRKIQREGPHVLKQSLLGVTLNCSLPFRLQLDGPQDHILWIFEVVIKSMNEPLSQVALLRETHLDKFKFLRSPGENGAPNAESIRILKEDFVEDSSNQESIVQFCVQFSSNVFGEFEQELVFDFGYGNVLYRSIFVSVVSKDISGNNADSRTKSCHVLEWSDEEMELVPCKELLDIDLDGLCEQYNIPNTLPDPTKLAQFKRDTYCQLWHDILFTEEQHIKNEVARYDIQNGSMKVVNSFESPEETVFATAGNFFGEIVLSDLLIMDEVAGHLINRSVMSVILRLKVQHYESKRIYECCIKLKTPQLVVIKLNEALCKDYKFQKDEVVNVDIKFQYNRLPMCEMHQAIDLCKLKTEILLPDVNNVSYKNKKSINDLFMDSIPNSRQHEAIAMILHPSPTPPILVIGPFGTGKTFTLNLACEAILSQSKPNKVLICTHSNSAADIHLSLMTNKNASKKIRPLRVLSLYRRVQTVPCSLRGHCLIRDNAVREPTWDDLHDRNVVITTLASARMLWKFYQDGKLHFTHILIDEGAQALEPECLTPLVMADGTTTVVLAGDTEQMGPPFYSKRLWRESLEQSLLGRLFTYYKQHNEPRTPNEPSSSSDSYSPSYVVLLTENYRCHADILQFPSESFYGGKLIARGDQGTHECIPVLSFYAAQGLDQQVEGSLSYYNEAEVAEVVKRVEELVNLWPKDWPEDPAKHIGVITPYHDQVKRIREGLRKKRLNHVTVERVENVQGKEFKALFISTVRTRRTCLEIENRNSDSSQLDFGFLSDHRFVNTAVTRAQSLLAVVGDPISLCSVGACRSIWKDYLKRCKDKNGLHGCTLKTIMDDCLRRQTLNPNAHEFTPSTSVQVVNENALQSTFSNASLEVSGGNSWNEREKITFESESMNRGDSSAPCAAEQHVQTAFHDDLDVLDYGGSVGYQMDSGRPADEDNNATNTGNNDSRDVDSERNETSAIENFFRRDSVENFDDIIQALIKACDETRNEDKALQARNAPEGSPSRSAPLEPGTFYAGVRDGRIELGFHVTASETVFRLTGRRSSFRESNAQSFHDTEADATPGELLKLVKENPAIFLECTFRSESTGRLQRYYGQLQTPDSPNIYIPDQVRGVYEDDIVVLELEPNGEENVMFGSMKGALRSLIDPRERQFVCTVDRTQTGLMVPINRSMPKLMNFTKTDEDIIPIYKLEDNKVTKANILRGRRFEEALSGERVFVVKFLKWRTEFPHPLGLAVRHIPQGKDFRTGMTILYEEHNIRREFDSELRTSIKKDFLSVENWQVPQSESGRPTYRDDVFTIDPPQSLDLDDAISIRLLGNGNYQLQVHIADVCYFVKPNTLLDQAARLRGTSYYPPRPDESVPMLPRELSEGCCSLLLGKDRLAVTMIVEVTPDWQVVGDTRMERSVVRSSRRLTYQEAQQIINETRSQQPGDENIRMQERQVPVREAIGVLHRIAQGQRRSRLGLGGSMYHRKRDDYDENEREAHAMIEEIMNMVNCLVAKYLLTKFPTRTPLRVQPPPKLRRVTEWRQRFQQFLNLSLAFEWLRDSNVTSEGEIELKVPFETWNKIMMQLDANEDSNYEELAKLVCNLDLFPQLAIANAHQQQLEQRGRYASSGEVLENIPYPWAERKKANPSDRQNVSSDISSSWLPDGEGEDLEDITNEGNVERDSTDETPAASSCTVNETANRLSSVRNNQELKRILHGHWGLHLDAYCHFTSPIRRYIDIIVHRLVVAAIENEVSTINLEDLTTLCDRCTYISRNADRFKKKAKKLKLAVDTQGSPKFVQAFIDNAAQDGDSLKLFFDAEEYDALSGTSLRISRLGPDQDLERDGDHIKLQWTFRFVRLDINQGRAQPRVKLSQEEASQAEDQRLANLSKDNLDNFTVSGDLWSDVLEAVKKQDKHLFRTRLQQVDEVVKKRKAKSSTNVSLLNDPSSKTGGPYQHPNAGKKEPNEVETDEFLRVTRSFVLGDRVKVQICSRMTRGILSPTIQLFKITEKIHACVEHRSYPVPCFAKKVHERPGDIKDIRRYVSLWKPVLMMEIATSAVRDDDTVTLLNLRVSFSRIGIVKMNFELSIDFCMTHFLTPLEGNFMCVRVKNHEGYWVGHFRTLIVKMEASENTTQKKEAKWKKKDDFLPVEARLLHSATPVPEFLFKRRFCYVTAKLIYTSIPNRRCLAALENSVQASDLIQEICTGQISVNDDRSGIPRDLSLRKIYPALTMFHELNECQSRAVRKALKEKFTLVQGPPGTGKTVTGVHIAYWFAQQNRERKPKVNDDGEERKGSLVFYCGPSNKSVDVVARLLKKIPKLKILRVYGQEIERKIFPVPDKITQFRSKRVSAQLNADDELKNISIHYVIRSRDCPYAEKLKNYDHEFATYITSNTNAPREKIDVFNRIKSKAERWAITQTGVQVILATCTTANSPRLKACREYHACQCIVDECGMCIEAETLCAMLGSNAEQVVLIGDHKQLQPIITCREARDLGLGISMFERFSEHTQSAQMLVMLKIQYRMHEELCEFPSTYFYEGKLETAQEVLEREADNVTWSNESGYPFVFHHVEGIEESLVVTTDKGNENSKMNRKEIDRVILEAQKLINEGVKGENIIVLSPYRAQCYQINHKLKEHKMEAISAMTVVSAQGSEKDYIILSLVRSLPKREIETKPAKSWIAEKLGFVTDPHQINVALTRAKRGLTIIGNATLIRVNGMWSDLLKHYARKGCLQ